MAGRRSGRLIQRGLVLLLVLGLAGCAAGSGGRVCAPELAATLPLARERLLVVEGKLNQQPARFVLDTGAEASHVTPDAVARYNLAHARGQTTVVGVSGRTTTGNAFGNIEIGGVEVRRRLSVVGGQSSRSDGPPIAGVLGADLLSSYDMEMSVPERVVRLWHVENCKGDYVPWTQPHGSVPLRRTVEGLLLLTATLDGHDLTAMLETGANATVFAETGVRRLHLTGQEMAGDPRGQNRGVDGRAVAARLHRFGMLAVGPERLAGPRLIVAGTTPSDGDMLLGLDWVRLRPIWISWSSRQLFLQALRAELPPPEPGGGVSAGRQGTMVTP